MDSATENLDLDVDVEALERRAEALADEFQDFMYNLVQMRKRHGLSQSHVARRMGISQPAVSDFERYDSNPTLNTIRRYSLAVGGMLRLHVHDCCSEEHDEDAREQLVTTPPSWVMPTPASRSTVMISSSSDDVTVRVS